MRGVLLFTCGIMVNNAQFEYMEFEKPKMSEMGKGKIEIPQEEVFSLVSRWNAYLKERYGKPNAAPDLVNINVFLEMRGPAESAMVSFEDFKKILGEYYKHEQISTKKFDEGIDEFLERGYPDSSAEISSKPEKIPKKDEPSIIKEKETTKSDFEKIESKQAGEVKLSESDELPLQNSEEAEDDSKIKVTTPEAEKKETITLTLDAIKNVISSQIGNKAKIKKFEITTTPEGIVLSAELDAGMMGGKISLDGIIVNSGNGLAVQNLTIEARGYVKSMIESSLDKFAPAIKQYFEKQYGKLVSRINIVDSNLIVELE